MVQPRSVTNLFRSLISSPICGPSSDWGRPLRSFFWESVPWYRIWFQKFQNMGGNKFKKPAGAILLPPKNPGTLINITQFYKIQIMNILAINDTNTFIPVVQPRSATNLFWSLISSPICGPSSDCGRPLRSFFFFLNYCYYYLIFFFIKKIIKKIMASPIHKKTAPWARWKIKILFH